MYRNEKFKKILCGSCVPTSHSSRFQVERHRAGHLHLEAVSAKSNLARLDLDWLQAYQAFSLPVYAGKSDPFSLILFSYLYLHIKPARDVSKKHMTEANDRTGLSSRRRWSAWRRDVHSYRPPTRHLVSTSGRSRRRHRIVVLWPSLVKALSAFSTRDTSCQRNQAKPATASVQVREQPDDVAVYGSWTEPCAQETNLYVYCVQKRPGSSMKRLL